MNSLWLEDKYVRLLSPKLDKFSSKGNHLYNFRCPICGDSEKNKNKSRGYIYEKDGHLSYKCHNCGVSHRFPTFLKKIDPTLHGEYLYELFKEKDTIENKSIEETPAEITKIVKYISYVTSIKSLPADHPAVLYVSSRKIPLDKWNKIFYTPKFMTTINEIIPGKFEEKLLRFDVPRLVLPFYDENGEVFAFTGRDLREEASQRYITIKFIEDKEKVYGLERVDFNKKTYVTEGPIDSLFLDNAIAFAGASGYLPGNAKNKVFIYDNEPRNLDIVHEMEKKINSGISIFIWPPFMNGIKDINAAILRGYSINEIKKIIDDNTFSGLSAQLKITEWKKIHDKTS